MSESRERETTGRGQGGPLSQPRTATTTPGRPYLPGLPTGMGLGKYRILERVKTTHNAIIYKARDILLDRLVTIKQMSPSLIDDPIACGNFRREAQFLARIPRGTSHVIGIHELIEDDLGLFIVEEYLPGDWLESLIAKRRIDLNAAMRILKTTALGLRILHSMRIAHRGIHPGNLLVAANGKAKITNLSTAAHESDTTPPPVIAPKYAAPELLLGQDYDDRVDIYALGMVLFEMCVGRPALSRYFSDILAKPAEAKTRWVHWHLDYRASLPNATDLNPLVPPQLSVLIRKMTSKNLDERIASVQEVLCTLVPRSAEPRAPRSPAFATYAFPMGWYPDGTAGMPPYASLPRPATPALIAGPASSVMGLRPVVQTSTCKVDVPAPADGAASARDGRAPASPRTAEQQKPVPRVRTGARKSLGGRRAVSRVTTVPVPETALTAAQEKPRRSLAWRIAAGIVLALIVGGLGWSRISGAGTLSPAEVLVQEAEAAREKKQLDIAEQKYLQLAQMKIPNELGHLRSEAESGIRLVQAERAIDRKDFDGADALLREAKRHGANPGKVDKLQSELWNKQDLYRLEGQVKEAVDQGNLATAERKADEFEKKAAASGQDAAEPRNRVEQARKDQKYAEFIERAKAALGKKDYEGALLACGDAENIKVTSDTRQLHKRILDLKAQAEWMMRGDEAMSNRDYRAAQLAYESGNQLEATPDSEDRVRRAGAFVLYEEAQAAIAAGDLLTAEQKLQASHWRYRIEEVDIKLTKLAPAFNAARLARKADWAMEQKDYAMAARLYSSALPDLPAPANAAVQEKLLRAQQAGQKVKDKPSNSSRD